MDNEHGKKAEAKIKEWLNRPNDGYSFDRIPDQMSGMFLVSRNISDFECYKFPYMYFIESKATYEDRFDFSMLTDTQRNGLRFKGEIPGVFGFVIVLFANYQRAFVFDLRDVAEFVNPEAPLSELSKAFAKGENITTLKVKSVNIKKIDKWTIPYKEIRTIPSRKEFLDYEGEIEEYNPNPERWTKK